MTSKYTDEQMGEIMETFSLFDTVGDGKIFAYQLGEVLRALGQNPTEAEVKKCGYSANPEARLSFEVCYPILKSLKKSDQNAATYDDYVEGLCLFDKDKTGTIGSAELRHVLCSLGDKLTDEECEQLFQGIEDSHGNICYEELIKMVMNG